MGIHETFSALRQVRSEHLVPALLLALDSNHELLKTYSVKALVGTRDEGAHRALIYRYRELPGEAREAIANSLHRLRAVLGEVVRMGDEEVRETALAILEANTSADGAECLAEFLTDERPGFRERAETALAKIVERFEIERDEAEEPVYNVEGDIVLNDVNQRRRREKVSEQARLLYSASKVALDTYSAHGKDFVIDAALRVGGDSALLVVDALRKEKEHARRGPGPVEKYLVTDNSVRTLTFLFERLCDHRQEMRRIAQRAFEAKGGGEVNSNFGYLLDEKIADDELRRALQLCDGVPWLNMMQGHVDRYPARALRRLYKEFNRLNADHAQVALFCATVGETRDHHLSEDCFSKLRALPLDKAGPMLVRLTQSKRQRSVLFAFQTMIEIGHPGALQTAMKLVESRWQDVKDAAASYLATRAYRKFNQQFERMSEAEKRRAGAPLRMVDQTVIHELQQQISAADADIRLRALRMLDLTNNAERMGEALMQLMHDPDVRVRATVVGMLGTLRTKEAVRAIGILMKDPDKRVRANAIEAIEAFGDKALARALIPYLSDANNRIRANAAKALYMMGVEEAADVMRRMLHDEAELMRMSAVWAIRECLPTNGEEWLAERRKVEELESILTRIDAALESMGRRRREAESKREAS